MFARPLRWTSELGFHHLPSVTIPRQRNEAVRQPSILLLRSKSRSATQAEKSLQQQGTESRKQPGRRQRENRNKSPDEQRSRHPLSIAKEALRALKEAAGQAEEQPADTQILKRLLNTTSHGDLPMSPLMDANLIEARKRRKTPKPDLGPLSAFEKEIALNPFALMLASPTRTCGITMSRAPSAFLRPFTLCKDPVTDTLWEVPKDLDPTLLGAKGIESSYVQPIDERAANPASELARKAPILQESDLRVATAIESKKGAKLKELLPTSWITGTIEGMNFMKSGARSKRGSRNKVPRHVTSRWRLTWSKEVLQRITVGDNHTQSVLDLLRKRCAHELAQLAQNEAASESSCIAPWSPPVERVVDAAESIEKVLGVSGHNPSNGDREETPVQGAVLLWLGDGRSTLGSSSPVRERLFGLAHAPILNPIIHLTNGRAVPVLNVESLLGEASLQWLQTQAAFTQPACLIRQTMESRRALGWIWRLHLFSFYGLPSTA